MSVPRKGSGRDQRRAKIHACRRGDNRCRRRANRMAARLEAAKRSLLSLRRGSPQKHLEAVERWIATLFEARHANKAQRRKPRAVVVELSDSENVARCHLAGHVP